MACSQVGSAPHLEVHASHRRAVVAPLRQVIRLVGDDGQVRPCRVRLDVAEDLRTQSERGCAKALTPASTKCADTIMNNAQLVYQMDCESLGDAIDCLEMMGTLQDSQAVTEAG